MRLKRHDILSYDNNFVAKTVKKRMADLNCKSLQEYETMVYHNDDEEEALVSLLRVGYSLFFRNSLTFSLLENIVLPDLIQKANADGRKEIRIWSAGCACGQESFSIAIILNELNQHGYRIFASDNSKEHIEQAQAGLFTAEDLSKTELKRVNKYFTKIGDLYKLSGEIISQVDFSVFDLLEKTVSPPSSIFGEFDLVLCCNLLFYYNHENQKKILEKIKQNVREGGYLATGAAEREIVKSFGCNEIYARGSLFRC